MHPPDAMVGEWACSSIRVLKFWPSKIQKKSEEHVLYQMTIFLICFNANIISVCCSCSPSPAELGCPRPNTAALRRRGYAIHAQ